MNALVLHVIAFLLLVFAAMPAVAETTPPKPEEPAHNKLYEDVFGWHEGPYLMFGLGMINTDHDVNSVTGEHFGNDYSLCYGLTFGWNITDPLAAEMQIRVVYNTGTFGGVDAHQWGLATSLMARYSFLTNAPLFHAHGVKLLPYAKGGVELYGIAVPGNANESRVISFGPGGVLGTGLEFLVGDHFVLDLGIEGALVYLLERKQNDVVVVKGGLDPQFNFLFSGGVKF